MVSVTVAAASSETELSPTVVDPATIIGNPDGPPLAGEELERRTQELAEVMRCPVCQALSVADSRTASAMAMREEASDLLAVGYSETQVLSYFEKSYGEFILLAPRKKGLNWLVWLAPIGVLLGGGALVLSKTGKRASPAEDGKAATSGGEDDLSLYAERVRQEVGND
jgi:cytochrome c-type biogenesis protein CcmH